MTSRRLKPMVLLIFVALFFGSYATHAEELKLPQWINDRIKSGKPLQGIDRYEFKKSIVYLVQTVCCDRGVQELYDESGKLICELKDSFNGLDDSKCPGFNKEKEWVASVYTKPMNLEQAKWHAEDEKLAEAARNIILTDESYGPIQFGSKLSDVEKAVGQKAWKHPYEGYSEKCRYVDFNKFEAVSLRVENGVVTGANSSRFDIVTTSVGIKDGMKLSDAKNKYPEMRIVANPHGRNLQHAVFESQDRKTAMVFTIANGKFISVTAGLRPSIADVPDQCDRK